MGSFEIDDIGTDEGICRSALLVIGRKDLLDNVLIGIGEPRCGGQNQRLRGSAKSDVGAVDLVPSCAVPQHERPEVADHTIFHTIENERGLGRIAVRLPDIRPGYIIALCREPNTEPLLRGTVSVAPETTLLAGRAQKDLARVRLPGLRATPPPDLNHVRP